MVKKTDTAAEKLTLVIAEKPSVAADLTRAITTGGKFKKEKTYYENGAYIVSWALGHLVTLCDPKEISDKYKSWEMETLPILPKEFQLKAIPTSKAQLTALGKLIRRKDVGTIVNACDAGREGELIFHYILEFEKGKTGLKGKTLKRLWMQSMTLASIREAFENLRTHEEMQNLLDAALSRSEADWLVGINGSRGLTAYNSRFGGFQLTPCGRVQTPTLAIIVNREEERNAFVSKPYWTIQGNFGSGKSEYEGKWFNPDLKTDKDHIWEEGQAEEIVKKCKGKTGTVTETTKPSTQKCGPLYDLTTLQREANNRFGFSAKTTLSIAQALYEKHKLTSYPRTDSRALPEDYVGTVKKTLGTMEGNLAKFAEKALENNWVKKDPRIFNNAKISDHFAIIPTGNKMKSLSEAELKVYTMICQRFIAVFYPAAEYLNTTRITEIEGEKFLTEGKILKTPGFKEVYGKTSDDESNVAPIDRSCKAKAIEFIISDEKTNPPPRYTESTLLSMMENAGKLVKDDELADAMKDRGMGTPATRAAIIEKLISDKYMVRDGKELIPTSKAFGLIQVARAMKIENLTSPELTGEWEYQLSQIEKGKETRVEFMKGIEDLTTKMVSNIRGFKEEDTKKEAAFSPVNGCKVYESVSRFETEDGIQIRKILGGRKMANEEIVELLTNKKIGPLTGFRSKRGMEFSAGLILENGKIKFAFDNADSEEIELGEELGKSPIDGSPVFDTLTAYVSQSFVDKAKTGLRLNKIILGKEISIDNIKKMLAGEKTDLIQGFRSTKTHRLFDAYLLLDAKTGKIKFEFPPRIPGKGHRFAKKKAEE